MTSPKRHSATVGSAGSGKTQRLIDGALAAMTDGRRVLITTYTIENRNQIERRIAEAMGAVPSSVDILTWYRFVISELCHPYQLAFLGEIGVVGALNFEGKPSRLAKKDHSSFYLDKNGDLYKDRVSAFALACNAASDGRVLDRVVSIYDEIFIDEMQDLAGHDFDLLDVLLSSSIDLHLVGDPRQALYFTDDSIKNKKYKGAFFVAWLEERSADIEFEHVIESHRCCQSILDWADNLFPDYDRSVSLHEHDEPGDGVHILSVDKVAEYIAEHGSEVTVLRRQKNTNTMGLRAINMGVSKGATYARVVVFGSKPMARYALGEIGAADLAPLERNRLYVAVTRARRSVVIVV
jgi:superfamily I DNA/RNA helicase